VKQPGLVATGSLQASGQEPDRAVGKGLLHRKTELSSNWSGSDKCSLLAHLLLVPPNS
jgi:hypothetical protein